MTSTQKGSEIFKTDKRGKVRMTPEKRHELLEEFDKSGLSAPKFAALTGLKYQTLAGWLIHRRKQRDGMAPTVQPDKQPTVQWLETVIEKAQATQAVPTSNLVVRLPSWAMIEVVTAAQARWSAKCYVRGRRRVRAEFHRRFEGVRGLAAL